MVPEFTSNSLAKPMQDEYLKLIYNHFGTPQKNQNESLLGHIIYINQRPEKFYCRDSYTTVLNSYLDLFKKRPKELDQLLIKTSFKLNNAFDILIELNKNPKNDAGTPKEDVELIDFVDSFINPNYVKLIEGVLAAMMYPIAYFSRLNRNVSTEGLDIYNIMQELSDTKFKSITNSYNNTIRNGIGHGGVSYTFREVNYTDKKGNSENIDQSNMIRLFDDLVDTCNGAACAIKYFMNLYPKFITQQKYAYMDFFRELTNLPWWHVTKTIDSDINEGKQLMVYCRTNSLDFSKVQIAAFQTATLAEKFIPGYIRYFISISSNKAYAGFARFDGLKLKSLRTSGTTMLEDYKGVLVEDLLFYVPRIKLPKIILIIDTYIHSIKCAVPLILKEYRKNTSQLKVTPRITSSHKNSWGLVVSSYIVIENEFGKLNKSIISKNIRLIIRKSKKPVNTQLLKGDLKKILPVGYMRVHVFHNDYRTRRLASFGLNEDLICTIQLKRIKRIQAPDIFGSTIEIINGYRVAWNKKWIEKNNTKKREFNK